MSITCEDIYLLKKEIERGEEELKKIQTFCTDNVLMDFFNGAKVLHDKHRRQPFTATPVTMPVEGLNPPSPDRPYSASEEPASAPPQPGMDRGQARSESPARKKNALYAERKTCKTGKNMDKDPLDIPSAQWLKNHGLVARRLTIMDALAPTAVPRTTKYIPILDKHVVSKVFDDVLPFAHVSNDKKFVTLINPQAAPQSNYLESIATRGKREVKAAVEVSGHHPERNGPTAALKHETALGQSVFSERLARKSSVIFVLRFKHDKPVSYVDHKESLLQGLENAGWPITYDEVMLLEDEILTGLTYLHQATELQAASREEAQRICPLQINPTKEAKKYQQKRKMFDALKGKKVVARSECTGFYYPGIVVRTITPFYALVDFIKGHTEIVPLKFIMPVGGAMPCPSLQVGDYVFVRIRKQLGDEHYVPGVIIATPNKADLEDKLYTVLKYNNRKEHCVRNGLIKISQRRYTCSCCYINMTRMMDHLIPNVKVVKQLHRECPVSKKERNTLSVGVDWKKSRKGRAKNKKKHYKELASSDSDEILFVPRRIVKRRENSSSPPPHIKEGSTGTVHNQEQDSSEAIRSASYCGSPYRPFPRGRKQRLPTNSSEFRPLKGLRRPHRASMRQQSAPQLVSNAFSSSSSGSGSSNSNDGPLSSIEKVEELARRLQQYHIAQRKGHPASCK
ncbi:von Willebrand factor A domain-containing protein 3B [Varanus komodoensis]|nr:von Willebrand factor A domain-containing protein 3B [Varanus komodoensis]